MVAAPFPVLMRCASTLVIATISALSVLNPGTSGYAQAQSPSDDTARARSVRQAGAPSATNDSVYRRAERLVREGQGDAGRALVDTLLSRTRPGTTHHGQALYWRASLAADAAEAERGYRRVIIEYPVSEWAGDALLNLVQLELARGDQEQALVHLHRFEREHPGHESRARASFWLARLYFDKKNDPRGCAVLANARAGVSPEDVELRNQIDYYGQRCMGVDTAQVAEPGTGSTREARDAKAVVDSAAAARPLGKPSARPSGQPSAVTQSTTMSPKASSPTVSTPKVVRTVGVYTVQIAAYDTRPPAEALIKRLKARGYTARLATSSRPFRVRVGRYDTRAEATAAQQRLKTKGIAGFVTEVEP